MSGPSRRCLAVPILWAVVLGATVAAAEPTATEQAAARTLFDEGRRLAAAGAHAQACPKFEESQRLDPGIGTQFNLADCYEQTGRTASAWLLFLKVASEARNQNQSERATIARSRAAALEPNLSRLSVSVAAEAPGMSVKLDGAALKKPVWGTGVPVDPGTHRVQAEAPGKKAWTATVEVAGNGGASSVVVPELLADSSAQLLPAATPAVNKPEAPAPSGAESSGSPGGTQRLIGWLTAGVGVIGLGVSVGIGASARSKLQDADAFCDSDSCWDQRGIDLHGDARSQATIATVVGGIGAAAVAGGLVLVLTAPKGDAPSRSAGLWFGPGSLGMKGQF